MSDTDVRRSFFRTIRGYSGTTTVRLHRFRFSAFCPVPSSANSHLEATSQMLPPAVRAALVVTGTSGAREILEAIVTVYVGPAGRRTALVSKHYDRRRIQSNSPNGQIHACFRLLRTLAKDQGLFFSLVGYAQQMPPLARDIRSSLEGVLQEITQQTDPNEVMTFLRSLISSMASTQITTNFSATHIITLV